MKRIIYMYEKGILVLGVIDENREKAWTELLSVGATVTKCSGTIDTNTCKKVVHCRGEIEAELIDIEKLERDGWEW